MDLLQEHLFTHPSGTALTESELAIQCDDLEAISKTEQAARAMVPAALALVRAAPKDERPQLLALRLMERARQTENMLDTWTGLHDRFPHLHEALRFMVRWLNRDGQVADSVGLLHALIENRQPFFDTVELAGLCAEIRDLKLATILFDLLLEEHPDNVSLRVIFGKYLLGKGEIFRAFDVLDPINEANISASARKIVDKGARAHSAMTSLGDGPASVLTRAIEAFSGRQPRQLDPDRINGICFYTGSLGAGGAERQLTQIASVFHHRKRAGRNIHGTRIEGTVEVVVNNVDESRGKAFFAPALKASGVPLHVTSSMPETSLDAIEGVEDPLKAILLHLPRNVRYGIERLTGHFRETSPDVAYFWQDGAVLNGALAALIAGVPRIVVSLRGLPPNLRPALMKPEYPDLYKALAKVPGVDFSCNSRVAANAYADWLGLPRDRFSVIYNVARKHPDDGEESDLRRWEMFDQDTKGSTFTLGGIFRFNPNKRARTWLELASQVHATHPNTRFVLVGDGEQLSVAQDTADALGIGTRVLFVGRSQRPGFWLSKMDALCLLSENEGLPNVLIEAQLAAKPVISTPAGGAAETFSDTDSGYLLSSSVEPSPHEFHMYADALISDPALCARMGKYGQAFAEQKFDRETILAQTVRFFLGDTIAGDAEIKSDAKITKLPARQADGAFDPLVRAAYNVGSKF